MIKLIPNLPGKTLGFEVSGKVTAEDYETVLMPAVEAACAKSNKVRMLYHLPPSFEGFDLGAMWDDTKVGLAYMGAWEKIAVVTDVGWIRSSVKVFGFALPVEVKVYENAQIGDAKSWLAT